mgnify:CR=1 FL=1
MKKLFTLFLSASVSFSSLAQTWSGEVAEIFYENCAGCHNPSGIGSVSLVDYENAFDYKSTISAYVSSGIMPPWMADSSFQHYFDERILTDYERTTILDWVSAGAPEGVPSETPPPPVFSEKILPGAPDLTVQMDPYMSKASPISDDYVCIAIPSGLTEDKKLKAIEVIPGNRPIVHHCLVYTDEDGDYLTDTLSGGCSGPDGSGDELLLGAYAPGSSPTIFPADYEGGWVSGMEMKAGSNIILAMHYPHGSYGEFDDTKVNFYFYEEPIAETFREVYNAPLIYDGSFLIPADEVDTLTDEYGPIPLDLTFLSAFPHMHLLGEEIEAYAIDPGGDTIPFVRIPKWDFEWQDFYNFQYLQKVPEDSYVYGRGVYNNTSSNPFNPNDPPEDVTFGENTTDEMFIVSFGLMFYWPGDEDFNVDSANTVFLSQPDFSEDLFGFEGIEVYPNPFSDVTKLQYSLQQDSYVSIYIYDQQGRLIRRLQKGDQQKGLQSLIWDGRSEDGAEVGSGAYFYSMSVDGALYNGRIVKR